MDKKEIEKVLDVMADKIENATIYLNDLEDELLELKELLGFEV